VPNVVGSKDGWKLYIVTGGVMVGIARRMIMLDSLMIAF
jgi:hypothetical protein